MIKSLKKITILGSLVGAALLSAPFFASAKTNVILAPAVTNVNLGEQFTMVVNIDPENTVSYAEKVVITYPSDALDVVSFTYGDSWTPLAKDGYEKTDDTKGTLTRTAEFPGGFSDIKRFATITFVAKKAASGTIHIENGSLSYEAAGQTRLTGAPMQFTVVVPPVQNLDASNLGSSVISTGFIESAKTFFFAISIMSILILLFTAFPSKVRKYLFKLK